MRGRPPKVREEGNDFSITVKGSEYKFRLGNDKRLRQVGGIIYDPEPENEKYARDRVMKHVAAREESS